LAKEIKEKASMVKSLYEKRETEMFKIEFENVKKELLNFAKEKNYERIFDVSDNYEKFGLSSYKTIDESKISSTEKLDITKDFIFYYNSAKKVD